MAEDIPKDPIWAALKRHNDLIEQLHQRIAGLQYALLGIVGGIDGDDPDKMIASLERVKAAALPTVSSKDSLFAVKTTINYQMDLLIEHVRDTHNTREGSR